MSNFILVTGGNRGIGLATCKHLVSLGCPVLMGCRDVQQGRQLAQDINGEVHAVYLSLDDTTDIQSQLSTIIDRFPTIRGLINNAAHYVEGTLTELSTEDFYSSMAVNLFGPFELCRKLVPHMLKQGGGRVVNVSSSWGAFSQGMAGPSAYAISKAALNAMTLSLAASAPACIKVNAVDPGWVRTRMGGPEATRSPEQATDTICWLATLDDDGPNGGFFRDRQAIPW